MIILYANDNHKLDLFDIDFHIFTVIKFLFNLVVRFKYYIIYILSYNILNLTAHPGKKYPHANNDNSAVF